MHALDRLSAFYHSTCTHVELLLRMPDQLAKLRMPVCSPGIPYPACPASLSLPAQPHLTAWHLLPTLLASALVMPLSVCALQVGGPHLVRHAAGLSWRLHNPGALCGGVW